MLERVSLPDQALPKVVLDRHAQRRRDSIPTISVLSGPIGLAIQAWSQWAAGHQLSVVLLPDPDPQKVATLWAAALARQRELTRDAVALLAAHTQRSPEDVQADLQAKTLHDLERFWERLLLDRDRSTAAAVCHWLTQQRVVGEALHPSRLAQNLDTVLSAWEEPWRRVVVALSHFVPAHALPCLLLAQPRILVEPLAWADAAARLLASLASQAPQLPVALALEPATLDRYFQNAPESHAQALLREGLVQIPALSEAGIAQRFRQVGLAAPGPAGAARRLGRDGASEELVRAFIEAAQCVQDQAAGGTEDRARSAAERFLFERMEALPETAGRFEMNGGLDFRFGPADAEVDLLARDLQLAVEVDGYYHFRDPEAYRRDRRKDWELQRRGYLVLRFLADDVVARMEEMLDTILAAVEYCRQHPHLGRTTEP